MTVENRKKLIKAYMLNGNKLALEDMLKKHPELQENEEPKQETKEDEKPKRRKRKE